MARRLKAKTTQEKVSRWVHVVIVIAVYILGNFAFFAGAFYGTSDDVWVRNDMSFLLGMLIFMFGGVPIGVLTLLVHGIFTVALDARAVTQLSPLQRVLASAILALLVVFIAGFLWW